MNFDPSAFGDIASPGLLVWPAAVERNIARMIAQVDGDLPRLRPHVKTHKMVEVVRLQLDAGISKFKCATIAEAEMLAMAGSRDVLLAYQMVGPNARRLAELARLFPESEFATLVDDTGALERIAEEFSGEEKPLRVFVDVDCGMGRTGTFDRAVELCRMVSSAEGVEFAGLHVYDGHLHAAALGERQAGFEEAFAPVRSLIDEVQPPAVVGGGSPTFGLHAEFQNWECSPGTTTFWDAGYAESYPDLDYEIAGAVLTRVVSKPSANRLCLDLGHKAIAAENPLERRVRLPGLPADVQFIGHNEEHLVVETSAAADLSIGDALIGIPVHICPTVALHMEAVLIGEDGVPTGGSWKIAARDRRITV